MKAKEKFILITGGSRGIGRAITLSQASKGTVIFVNYLRDEESAEKMKKEAQRKGARVHLVPGNVGDPESVLSILKSVRGKTHRLDALVHNAALGVFKPVSELRVKDWDISLDVNAKALLMLSQAALPLMKARGGKILAVSSLGSQRYTPNYGAIGISKAALENLVRYLAVELAPHRVRVNAVSGGLIETDSLKITESFQIKVDANFIFDPVRIANEYNKHYVTIADKLASIADKLASNIPDIDYVPTRQVPLICNSFVLLTTGAYEI